MRLEKNKIIDSEKVQLDEEYIKLKMINEKNFFLISNILIIPFLIVFLYWTCETYGWKMILVYISLYFFVAIFHEISHGAIFPGGLKSKNTVLNINFKKFYVCCYYNGEIEKDKLIFSEIFPLIILTIFPGMLFWFGISSIILIWIGFINMLISIGDIINFINISFRLPSDSKIILKGNDIYYKLNS